MLGHCRRDESACLLHCAPQPCGVRAVCGRAVCGRAVCRACGACGACGVCCVGK